MRVGGSVAIVAVALLSGGCATLIAPMIVAPQPGGFQASLERTAGGRFILEDMNAYISAHRRIAVGPPPAKLSIAVIPAGQYTVRFGTKKPPGCMSVYLTGTAQTWLLKTITQLWMRAHHVSTAQIKTRAVVDKRTVRLRPPPISILSHYQVLIARLRRTTAPRGTVILLPGYGVGKLALLPWALLLGTSGYRTILVDLRAQGQSTGKHVTFGARESTDLVQLVAALRAAGLIRGRLGLFGDSMGAATALLAAPHIPDLAAVVAISPYGRVTTIIPRYARLATWYGPLISRHSWKVAEHKAGHIAGVNLAEAAPIRAVAKIRAPVLYVQGGRDQLITLKEAHRLDARTPNADLLIYPKLGHLQLSTDVSRWAQPVIDWYNRYLARDNKRMSPPLTGPPVKQSSVRLSGCVRF